MSLVLTEGGAAEKLGVSALDFHGSVDPNAKISGWTSDNTAAVTVADNGDGTANASPVAAGAAMITAAVTDPDGKGVETAAFAVTVVAAGTDTTTATIVDLGPVAAPPSPAPGPTPF